MVHHYQNDVLPQRTNCMHCAKDREVFKRRALAVLRRSWVDMLKIHFMNGTPLSKRCAPPKNKLHALCKRSWKLQGCNKDQSMFEKERRLQGRREGGGRGGGATALVVCQITCKSCGLLYIGETGRTIESRIKENLTVEKRRVINI